MNSYTLLTNEQLADILLGRMLNYLEALPKCNPPSEKEKALAATMMAVNDGLKAFAAITRIDESPNVK